MAVVDRFLLFIYSLIVGIFCLLAILTTFGFPQGYIPTLTDWDVIGLAAVLLLMSLRFLFYSSRRRGRSDKHLPAIVTRNENGEVRISLETLESLVLRASRSIRGVSEVRPQIRVTDAGVRIAVRLIVEPDTNIPNMSSEVQAKVKSYVSSLAGVTVEEVIVSVKDLRKNQVGKSRGLA